MAIRVERSVVASREDAEARLRREGFHGLVGPIGPRPMETPHFHEIDVVLAAVEGTFVLQDGSTGTHYTIEAGDWTLTPRGTLHAFSADAPAVVAVGFSEPIPFDALEALPASALAEFEARSG